MKDIKGFIYNSKKNNLDVIPVLSIQKTNDNCNRLTWVQYPNNSSNDIAYTCGPHGAAGNTTGRINQTTYGDGTIVQDILNEVGHTRTIDLDGNTMFTLNLDGEGRAAGTSGIVEQYGGANNLYKITRDNMGRVTNMLYPKM